MDSSELDLILLTEDYMPPGTFFFEDNYPFYSLRQYNNMGSNISSIAKGKKNLLNFLNVFCGPHCILNMAYYCKIIFLGLLPCRINQLIEWMRIFWKINHLQKNMIPNTFGQYCIYIYINFEMDICDSVWYLFFIPRVIWVTGFIWSKWIPSKHILYSHNAQCPINLW